MSLNNLVCCLPCLQKLPFVIFFPWIYDDQCGTMVELYSIIMFVCSYYKAVNVNSDISHVCS